MESSVTVSKYELGDVIGSGGFGFVRKATGRSSGRVYALKVIDLSRLKTGKTIVNEDRLIKMAENEAVIMRRFVHHDNIVKVFDYYLDGMHFFLVMEFCAGRDLAEFIKNRKNRAIAEMVICNWSCQLVMAISYLHCKNIIHRDIKPSNILLSSDKATVKLGDFGIAKDIGVSNEASTQIGTFAFCSPEYCKGKPYTKQSESWSLGVTVYQMATRDLPFITLGNQFALADLIMNKKHAPIPETYSPTMADFIDKLLAKKPDLRLSISSALSHEFILPFLSRLYNSGVNAMEDDDLRPVHNPFELTLTGDIEGLREALPKSERTKMKTVRDKTNETLLHKAVRSASSSTMLKYLLDGLEGDYSDWLNSTNHSSDTALHLAVARSDLSAIVALCEAGASINSSGGCGDNAKMLMECHGTEIAGRIENIVQSTCNTPLHVAALFKSQEVVTFLLEHNANPMLKNSLDDFPMHYAALSGDKVMFNALLNRSLSSRNDQQTELLHSKNKCGDTLLHLAAARGYQEAIVRLCEAGADVNCGGGLGDNFSVLSKTFGKEMTDRFMTIARNGGNTALHIAALFRYPQIIEHLLENNAKPMLQNNVDDLPVHFAAISGAKDIVKIFFDNGVPANVTGRNDRTVLHYASANNRLEVVKFLLETDRNVDVAARQASDDSTPLHIAAHYGYNEIIELLLKQDKAIMDLKRRNGVTPLGEAIISKNVDTVELLLKHGADVKLVRRPMYIVRGKDKGRPAWHFVAVRISDFRQFIEQVENKKINVSQFGDILQSGWGDGLSPEEERNLRQKFAAASDKS